MAKKQTAGRDRLGDLAPKFAELNDDILFGEVWSREEQLSARDRSMITIAALFSAGLYPQLKSHGPQTLYNNKKAMVSALKAYSTMAINVPFQAPCSRAWIPPLSSGRKKGMTIQPRLSSMNI